MFAISQQQPAGLAEQPGSPSDTINFYDVTAVGTPGATNVFNNDPLFSVWLGYEIFEGEVGDVAGGRPRGNREDTSALTFNPANGTIYAIAFDSGTPGQPDTVGDNQGDNDLYRIDYQELLKDFTTNSRPKGTIYAPTTQRIAKADEQFLSNIASPLFDGTVDEIAHNVPHPASQATPPVAPPTVYIDNAILKIGEVGRAQSPFSFFDTQMDFVDPATMVLLDTATRGQTGATSSPDGDFQIRSIKRVSTSPGAAVIDADGPDNGTGPAGSPLADDDQQGGRNGNSVQSWESKIIGRLRMDEELTAPNITDPGGWALVKRDGKLGVWVADNESANTGDEVAYFELDLNSANPTATRKPLPTSVAGSTSFRVDENPTASGTTNDGEIDFLYIDKGGNLVVGESGFFDTTEGSTTPPLGSGGLTAQQPRVMTVGIESYNNAAGVVPAGFTASGGTTTFDSTAPWTVSASVPVPADADDTDVLNTTKVAYDRSNGFVYIIDQDSDFFEDMYVFDPATGQVVYHEINGLNPGLFNTGTQIIFTRGDFTGNGVVDAADIAALQAGIADPTLGGTVTAALGAEWYDLTGDGLLTQADLDEMLTNILSAPRPGDFNSDGKVDGADLVTWRQQYGTTLSGNDFLVWQRNLGAGTLAAVPEPSGVLVAASIAGALGLVTRRRRSK